MTNHEGYYEILNPVHSKNDKQTRWYRIGVLFKHGDKFTGELHESPINGQIVVKPCEPKDKPETTIQDL